MINSIDKVVEYIQENENFIVTSHISPDGDNVGSTLAMYLFLKNIGKNVYYVLDDNIPLNLHFLSKNVNIMNSSEVNLCDYAVIALDCGDKNRICLVNSLIDNSNDLIVIDHHYGNYGDGSFGFIDRKASSTCEMVFRILKRYKKLYSKNIFDEEIATCLYTGLVTDTGNFEYTNSDEETFDIARELLLFGANKEEIILNLFQSNSYGYYKLLGDALNTLEIYEGKIACITLTNEMLKENGVNFNDTDGITPYTRDIEGVDIGILFKEKDDSIVKVSFRSKNNVNVNQLARVFGGGGHMMASGCTINDNIESAKEKVIKVALEVIKGEK